MLDNDKVPKIAEDPEHHEAAAEAEDVDRGQLIGHIHLQDEGVIDFETIPQCHAETSKDHRKYHHKDESVSWKVVP